MFVRVIFEGLGAEVVYGTLTKDQINYWKKSNDLSISDYISDDEKDETYPDVPKKARIKKSWYDIDDIDHIQGIYINDENNIIIQEIKSLEYGSKVIKILYEKTIPEFLAEYHPKYEAEKSPKRKKQEKEIFYGMSVQRGTMKDYIFKVKGKKFTIADLGVSVTEIHNGDHLIEYLHYKDEMLDSDGATSDVENFEANIIKL